MNNTTTIFLLIIIFLLTILFLWLVNSNRNERHHQLGSVIGSCLFAMIFYFLYAQNILVGSTSFLENSILPSSWKNQIGKALYNSTVSFILFSFILLSLFMPIKIALIKLFKHKFSAPSPALSLGVYEQREERILLNSHYYYPLRYMLVLVISFSVMYCLSFLSYQIGTRFPVYGLLLIFCFLEAFWFLNGREVPPKITVNTVTDVPVNYLSLWKEYTERWNENLGVAFTKKSTYDDWTVAELEGEVLIKNYKQGKIFLKVRSLIADLINKGQTIIIFIPDNIQPLIDLKESEKYKIVTKLLFGNEFTSQYLTTDLQKLKQAPTIYLTSIDRFLLEKVNIEEDAELYKWFKKMRMVIYFGYDVSMIESPESSVSASSVLKYLAGSPDDFMSIVFAEDRQAQQASWRSNLKINPQQGKEVKIDDNEAENMYYLGWKSEYRYESGILNHFANRYVGPTASLHLLPYCYGVRKVNIKVNETRAYFENIENININRDEWQNDYNSMRLLPEKSRDKYRQIHLHHLSLEQQDEQVLFVTDKYNNAPYLYKYYAGFGKQHHLLHIISDPHILREYFNDNFEYFSKNPIKPLSYMLINGDKFTLALSLLEKLVKCKLSIEELSEEFIDLSNDKHTVIEQLRDLFKNAYDFDIVKSNSLKVSENQDGRFLISLSPDVKSQIELFKSVRFIDTHSSDVFLKNKNLLFQKYLIGQIHAFNGRLYKIRSITSNISKDIIVRLDNIETRQNFSYMEKKTIELFEGNYQHIESLNPTNEYSVGIYSRGFKVKTEGYYQLDDGNSLSSGRYTFHHSTDIERTNRNYKYGRMCKITFSAYENILNIENAVMTVRVILKEAFKTLFPDSYHYLIIRCFGLKEEIPQHILSDYYSLTNRFEVPDSNEIGIYIFEDSIFDMGHLKSIVENINYILNIIDDYLAYLIEKVKSKPFPVKTLNNHIINEEEIFLSFELEDIKNISDFPYPLDIFAAKNLTSKCLRLQNEITSDRLGKKMSRETAKFLFSGNCSCCNKSNRNQDNATFQMDKRIVCKECLNDNKRSKDSEKQIVDQTHYFFETNYQTLPKNIKVEFSNLNDIRTSLQEKRRFPHAALRVVFKDGQYTVFIENYRDEAATISALIHALTHVYQIAYLDIDKLKKENKYDYLDGHAFLVLKNTLNNSLTDIGLSKNDLTKIVNELGFFGAGKYEKAARQLKAKIQEEEVFRYLNFTYPVFEASNMELSDY